MSPANRIFFGSALILATSLFVVTEGSDTITFSVVVPCIPRDVEKLPRLMHSISAQTYQPLEVIIAVSETGDKAAREMEGELAKIFPIVTVLETDKMNYAGENRNRGAARAKGSFISFFDADDEMHPERLGIIHDAIHTLNPKCVLHSDTMSDDTDSAFAVHYEFQHCEYFLAKDIFQRTQEHDREKYHRDGIEVTPEYPLMVPISSHVQYGHITCQADVLKKEQFSSDDRGQDVRFARQVLRAYGPSDDALMLINLPLSAYHPSDHPYNSDLNKMIDGERRAANKEKNNGNGDNSNNNNNNNPSGDDGNENGTDHQQEGDSNGNVNGDEQKVGKRAKQSSKMNNNMGVAMSHVMNNAGLSDNMVNGKITAKITPAM